EVSPAFRSINVYYDPLKITINEVIALLKKSEKEAPEIKDEKVRRVFVPTIFGGEYGPDLEDVARQHNMKPEKVVKIFTQYDYLNYFIGFMPGKPYLGGLPKILETPRKKIPRFNVRAGAVVIYGRQVALFGLPEPTGTNWIGCSPIKIYDNRKKEPILLKMGDYLRFYSISEEEFLSIEKKVKNNAYDIKYEMISEDEANNGS
ncbi:MAG: allophanate hydrolase subunit 1, partial [Thermoplasmata archaeon]|nr:allophanate hydrolase subunit 1 [Thermoplasmata archaeon]